MAKTIITQTGDAVNYGNIAAIYTDDNLVENPDGTESLTYILCADTVRDITYVLGEYDTENEALNARNNLVKWLDKETFGIYRVAENEGDA